ncbi:hypothetical protein PENTCL1PPCAC_22181, partial [Pristionchus entomophagus]
VLLCSSLLGLFAYYKARSILIFPHLSFTYRTPSQAPCAHHAQLHTSTPSISLLATTPAYSFASTTAVSRTPQRHFNIDRHQTPLSVGWSAKSCATALSIKSLGAASVSTYNEDSDHIDVEISECSDYSHRTLDSSIARPGGTLNPSLP